MFPFTNTKTIRIGEVTFYEKEGVTYARKRRNNISASKDRVQLRKNACICTSLSPYARRMPEELKKVLMSQGGKYANRYGMGITKYNFHSSDLPYISSSEKLKGVEILSPVQISNGIIPPITDHLSGSVLYTNIYVGGVDREINTVEELTTMLVDSNRFSISDSLYFLFCRQDQSGTVPRMSITPSSVHLDLFDPSPLSNYCVKDGFICYQVETTCDIWACSLIAITASLAVSTERLQLNDRTLLEKYQGEIVKQKAFDSYRK